MQFKICHKWIKIHSLIVKILFRQNQSIISSVSSCIVTIISFEYRLLLHRHSAHCQYKTTLDSALDKAAVKNPKYIECEISILSPLPNKTEICTRIN